MPLSVDPRSHLPLHAQVERLLRELCARPEHRGGALLPDEVGLARTLGVSRNTVRAAIERMVHEGLLERRRGVGTRVARAIAAVHATGWNAFLSELEPLGEGVSTLTAETTREGAVVDTARSLAVDEGTELLRLDRLVGDADGPLAFIRSWFHPRVAPSPEADLRRPLWRLIEDELGLVPTIAHEELTATIADPELARRLSLRRGAAVLLRRRIVADAQGRPLECALAWYHGGRARRQVELRRDPKR